MCIFTHFAVGALAGGLTGNVYMGAAAGFVSHAVLDVIPHYDHPDWRLELGGGIAALLLLLFMPFFSWPALVGGIFGMVPDLENLAQKLGKLRRSQMVYPTHTGLLPHGKNLGPKSIVWQFGIFAVSYLLLGMFSPSEAHAAPVQVSAVMDEPQVQVLESSTQRTVLRVSFPVTEHPVDWQTTSWQNVHFARPPFLDEENRTESGSVETLPPRMLLSLAVPTRRPISWSTRDIQWWKVPSAAPAQIINFSAPIVSRSVPITGGELALAMSGGVLREVTIEVNHPATGNYQQRISRGIELSSQAANLGKGWDTWLETIPTGVLNPSIFEVLSRGGVEAMQSAKSTEANKVIGDELFSLSTHWVKLNLNETGLYRLTGQELSGYGVSTSTVDPAKIRLYRGGGLPLATDPEVAEADQLERVGLNELAIELVDGNDGEWNLDDEIRFYGVSTSTWLDRFDATAEPLDHMDHPMSAEAVYWLTWEDDQTPSPMPGAPKRAPVVNAPSNGGIQQSTARMRLHEERQFISSAGRVADNWLWDNSITSSRLLQFEVRTPEFGLDTRFQIDVRGVYPTFAPVSDAFDIAGRLNADQVNRAVISFNYSTQNDSLRVRLIGDSPSLVDGTNTITVTNNSLSVPKRSLALDSFDILYWTKLELTAGWGQFEFAHWADQVLAPATNVDLVVDAVTTEMPLLWDVSDPANVSILQGSAGVGNSYVYGVVRAPDTSRHFVATHAADLKSVTFGSTVTPSLIRGRATDLDYVVIHAPAFLSAAARLADHHSDVLPGIANPRAAAYNVEDIYDNFSGGQKDFRAIRNFLNWLYVQSGMRLKYVCFLGNASRDYRNYNNRTPLVELYDLVSTELRTTFPINPNSLSLRLPYSSDDGLVSFDSVPPGDFDFPDLATGRLPALNVSEANAMVDRAIAFSGDTEPGLWRNRVIMTADDVVRPSSFPTPSVQEYAHTRKAEQISTQLLPLSLDQVKLYGVDYDFPPGSRVKPQMRSDINNAISEGATIFYYVGHGSEDNLADEQIFQSRDISNLTNGMKRPVFIALSCDVGVFDSINRRSMAEQFLQYDTGGAIGAICAAEVSFISYNELLSDAFFSQVYPARHVNVMVPISESLRLSKSAMTSSINSRTNSQRYNLFGDPGMVLPHPVDDLAFTAASVDTLRAGLLQNVVIEGSGKALLAAGDSYSLLVEESAFYRRFPFTSSGQETTFVKAGAPVFAGNGSLGAGDHAVPFKAPIKFRFGDEARVRMVIESPDGDHSAAVQLSAIRSTSGPSSDIVGPSISLSFSDNKYRVRPGEEMNAALVDTSGIAILGTSPGNSLLLELDDSGFMTDVTQTFVYEPDSYTAGSVTFQLPADLAMGRHMAALHASDALGNVGSDTLSFEIVAESIVDIHSVTLFPNPTPGPCRLIFELSDPMEVQWDIYSLAGSRLRTIKQKLSAGPQIINWDGRDGQSDEIANGTYLYVLRGVGATADDREIRKTGKLVIMR